MIAGTPYFFYKVFQALAFGLFVLLGFSLQSGWASEPPSVVWNSNVLKPTETDSEILFQQILLKPEESPLAKSEVTVTSGDALTSEVSPSAADAPSPPTPTIPTICTTRPSFTDSWLSIPQGSFQAESGVSYIDNSNKSRLVTVPETLLKIGVGKNTEFRFSTPSYTYLSSKTDGQLGNHLGDMTVGMVQHFALPKAKLDIALIPVLNLPTGANRVSSNALDPQLRVIVARTMTPKLTLATQFDARWNTSKNRSTDVMFNPTLIGYYAFTPKHVGFLEYAGLIPTQGKNQQFIQAGYLYVPTPRQQWDIRIATGLNRQSPDVMVGFGYSFRLDGLFGESKSFSSFSKNK